MCVHYEQAISLDAEVCCWLVSMRIAALADCNRPRGPCRLWFEAFGISRESLRSICNRCKQGVDPGSNFFWLLPNSLPWPIPVNLALHCEAAPAKKTIRGSTQSRCSPIIASEKVTIPFYLSMLWISGHRACPSLGRVWPETENSDLLRALKARVRGVTFELRGGSHVPTKAISRESVTGNRFSCKRSGVWKPPGIVIAEFFCTGELPELPSPSPFFSGQCMEFRGRFFGTTQQIIANFWPSSWPLALTAALA